MHHVVKRVSYPHCGCEQNIHLRAPAVGFVVMPKQDSKCINSKCAKHLSANLVGVFKSEAE